MECERGAGGGRLHLDDTHRLEPGGEPQISGPQRQSLVALPHEVVAVADDVQRRRADLLLLFVATQLEHNHLTGRARHDQRLTERTQHDLLDRQARVVAVRVECPHLADRVKVIGGSITSLDGRVDEQHFKGNNFLIFL